MTSPRFVMATALAILPFIGVAAQPASTQSPGLKIVVVEGEDAVNIIQQKTAVAPIVEVRDRNDQPVAGAIVRFAIQGGRATFGGAPTLTVTTNAVGQAVATGLTPTASGALQISATAAFQGQTAAAVTIAQTNVMTAAQAAAVSSAAGTSGGSASGAGAGGGSSGSAAGTGAAGGAGGGGGLSATTIGIVGGAVAGGAVVATQVGGGSPSGEQSYSGPFSFDWVVGCLVERMSGTISIDFVATTDTPGTPVTNGRLDLQNATSSVVSRPANCGVLSNGNWGMPGASVTGTLGSFESHGGDTVTSQVGQPLQRSYDFTGSLANGVITGTFTMTWRAAVPGGLQSTGTGPVTLSRAQ
jgi:hypothetical protein